MQRVPGVEDRVAGLGGAKPIERQIELSQDHDGQCELRREEEPRPPGGGAILARVQGGFLDRRIRPRPGQLQRRGQSEDEDGSQAHRNECYNRIMQKNSRSLTHLTNEQLIDHVKTLAARERDATAQLIGALAELDARGLYLGEGFPHNQYEAEACFGSGFHLEREAVDGR